MGFVVTTIELNRVDTTKGDKMQPTTVPCKHGEPLTVTICSMIGQEISREVREYMSSLGRIISAAETRAATSNGARTRFQSKLLREIECTYRREIF